MRNELQRYYFLCWTNVQHDIFERGHANRHSWKLHVGQNKYIVLFALQAAGFDEYLMRWAKMHKLHGK